MNTVSFLSFQSVSLFSLFLTLLCWPGPPKWYWMEVVRDLCLVLDLREEESIKSFTFKFVKCLLFVVASLQATGVPLCSWFDKTFYREWMVNILDAFSVSTKTFIVFLPLLVWWITLFSYVEPVLRSQGKLLAVIFYPFYIFLDLMC